MLRRCVVQISVILVEAIEPIEPFEPVKLAVELVKPAIESIKPTIEAEKSAVFFECIQVVDIVKVVIAIDQDFQQLDVPEVQTGIVGGQGFAGEYCQTEAKNTDQNYQAGFDCR
jgi:hypothetical protein